MEADYYTTICAIRPGSEFTINGNDYISLVWNDTNSTKPTKQEILNKIEDNENILKYEILRIERNKKLIESDKYMIEDFPHMTNEKRELFKLYRQQLRDLPSNITPEIDDNCELVNIIWPTKPILN